LPYLGLRLVLLRDGLAGALRVGHWPSSILFFQANISWILRL